MEIKNEDELFKQLVDESNCDNRKKWASVDSLIEKLSELEKYYDNTSICLDSEKYRDFLIICKAKIDIIKELKEVMTE